MKSIATATTVARLTLVGAAIADDTVRDSKAETDARVSDPTKVPGLVAE